MGQSSASFDAKKILPTPSFADTIVVEIVSRKLPDYDKVPYGTAHPETALFPDHRLVLQVAQNEEDVIRYYASDRATQQTFSASISYSGESATHPIFSRDHLIRRSAYVATNRNTPLSGLIDADVTAAGAGYTQATTTASLAGGTGTGGAVSVIVSPSGAVIGLYITALGNYTVAPNLTITDTGGGAGATGTVSIQPQDAVLVKEDMSAKTGDDRVDGLYVLVRFVYETLPGPWIPFTRWDLLLGPIQGRKRAVLNTGQVASLTATTKTTYQGREDSSVVLWEIEETNSNGTGGAGNPAFPILTDDPYDDRIRGAINVTRQAVVATGTEVGSISEAAGVVTRITYEAINQFLLEKKTETWVLANTPTITVYKYDEPSDTFTIISRRLKLTAAITEAITLVNAGNPYTITVVESEGYDNIESIEVATTETEPAARSVGTEIVTAQNSRPRQFPAVMTDFAVWVATGGLAGKSDAFVGQDVLHIQRTHWLFQSTAFTPTLTGALSLATIDGIIGGGQNIGDLIVDTGQYFIGGVQIDIAASTPDATDYLADYVGETLSVAVEARPDKNRYRIRVDYTYILYIAQAAPAYS